MYRVYDVYSCVLLNWSQGTTINKACIKGSKMMSCAFRCRPGRGGVLRSTLCTWLKPIHMAQVCHTVHVADCLGNLAPTDHSDPAVDILRGARDHSTVADFHHHC